MLARMLFVGSCPIPSQQSYIYLTDAYDDYQTRSDLMSDVLNSIHLHKYSILFMQL